MKERVRKSRKGERFAAGKVDVGTEDVNKHVSTFVYATVLMFMNYNQKSRKRTFSERLGYSYA